MGFKKVDSNEEIQKAIKNNSELGKLIDESDSQYSLIKSAIEHRKDKNITQKEIAEKSGLTQQMVSRIEKLDNSPTLVNFIRYLDAIGLELGIVSKTKL